MRKFVGIETLSDIAEGLVELGHPAAAEFVRRTQQKLSGKTPDLHATAKTSATPPQRILRHDGAGQVDDVAIGPVDLVRIERMDRGQWWLRLYMPDGEDYVFSFTSVADIEASVEVEPRDV